MTAYATDALLAAARRFEGPDPIALIRVELTDPSARTIRVATVQARTPDGADWQPTVVDLDPVSHRANSLDGGPNYAEFGFTLAETKLNYHASAGAVLTDSLVDFEWQGAKVVLYRWFPGLTSTSDPQQMFSGEIIAIYGDERGTKFKCRQESSFNRPLPDRQITKASNPGAPAAAIDRWLPVILGSKQGAGLRAPHATPYGTVKAAQESVGGATLVAPAIVTNTGKVGGKVVVEFAGHALETFDDSSVSCDTFIRGSDTLGVLDYTGTLTNDATGARIAFDLGTLLAKIGVLPVDVRSAATTCDDPLNATDLLNPETFALLNEPASKGALEVIMPSVGALGQFTAVDILICYATLPSCTGFVVRPRNPGGGTLGTNVTLAPTTGLDDVTVVTASYDSAWWHGGNWNFGGIEAPRDIVDLQFGFTTPGAQNIARVFWVAVRPKYQPSRNVLIPGRDAIKGGNTFTVGGRRESAPKGEVNQYGAIARAGIAAVEELSADFFHNARGWKDDGTGTFTSSPNTLIERVPDVAHFILRQYGKLTAGDVEVAGSAFASLVAARDLFNTADGFPIKVGRAFSRQGTVNDALTSLLQESGGMWFVNRFTGKHSVIRWDKDPDVTYTRELRARDLLDSRIQWQRQSEVYLSSGVSVRYGFDDFRGTTMASTLVAPDRSAGGYDQFDARDQYMTVVAATNDALDWEEDRFNAVLFGATAGNNRIQVTSSASYAIGMTVVDPYAVPVFIPAGTTITGIPDGTHVDLSNNALNTVGFGASICTIVRRRTATLTPGDYTGPALALEARTRMRAASPGSDIKVEYGIQIVTDVNDNMIFEAPAPGSVYMFKLTAGTYTPKRFAAYLQDTLASYHGVGMTIAVDYSFATRKLTFTSTGGSMRIPWATAASGTFWDPAKSAALVMGFSPASTAIATTVTSEIEVRGETFRLARAGTFGIDAATGPNVAKSAWGLLGFLGVSDRSGAQAYCADFRRGYRERQAKASAAAHTDTPPTPIECSWLNDARAATDLRDLTLAYRAESPIAIRFSTTQMPDVEIGMVFKTNADIDAVRKFPRKGGGGSWGGRKWRVLEVQDYATQNRQEIVAEEAGLVGTFELPGAPPIPVAGPVVTAWVDNRVPAAQIYVQKADGNGNALWTANGVQVSTSSTATTLEVDTAADGSGGTFLAYSDSRTGSRKDVYAQRLDGNGAAQSGWSAGGNLISSATGNKTGPRVVPDGAGGAIVAWEDSRLGGGAVGVAIQRINASGTVQWTANGVVVYSNAGDVCSAIDLVPDGTGGCFLAFQRYVGATSRDVLAAKITAAGAVSWTTTIVSGGSSSQTGRPKVTTDASSGCYVAFEYNGGAYAVRLTSAGAAASGWTLPGMLLSSGGQVYQSPVVLVNDTAGGILVFWSDLRASTNGVYGQRALAGGSVSWTAGGVQVIAGGLIASGWAIAEMSACADGSGGAFVGGSRQGPIYTSTDVGAQRVNALGAAQWGTQGVQVTNAAGQQQRPRFVVDGIGGVWLAWMDIRGTAYDVYAQRLDSVGTPALAANGVVICNAGGHQQNPVVS